MTLTPHQQAHLRTIQQRLDDEAAANCAAAARAQWQPHRKPESRVQRWLRKFFNWLDGGIE